MIGVTVLGATGSIGRSTLDVIARHPDRFRAVALTANGDVNGIYEQCLVARPDYAVLADDNGAEVLKRRLQQAGLSTQVLSGPDNLAFVAALPQADYVMAAIVGAAGLLPTLAAARAGKRILLANKEALVMSGKVFMDTVKVNGATLLPVDSEHNAIFQCMPAHFTDMDRAGVRRILLTASGGPFRTMPLAQLHDVTPDQACAHPNWVMGRKISVDSASMMNKGLELIEACWLFNTQPSRVQVVLHPQSIIHSMVEYLDGSVVAQMGSPDMRIPIAHALAWPERIESGAVALNLFDVAHLDFEPPDLVRFPCLRLAQEAMLAGGTATTILNAANEIAVSAFLAGQIRFSSIPKLIEGVLEKVTSHPADSLEAILQADALARNTATAQVNSIGYRLAS